jgi:ATP-dependent protease ClpP protease subunit
MAHQITYHVMGSHGDTKEEVEQVEKQERQWCDWMAELCNKDADFWYNSTYKRNLYLTATQCLEYGIVDEIF